MLDNNTNEPKFTKSFTLVSSALFLLALTCPAHAGDKAKSTTLDCSSGSLQAEIDKLDKSLVNIIEFTGDCSESIRVEDQRSLSLVGIDGASISGTYVEGDTVNSTSAVEVLRSKVLVQDVILNSGSYGLSCDNRSLCTMRNVTVQGGHNGVAAQGQSGLDIIGSSEIIDSLGWGVSAFGASTINMRPNWDLTGFDAFAAGPVVSGHSVGIWVQDGSFFRSDNVTVTENGSGVQAQRGVVIKMFVAFDYDNGVYAVPGAGVTNSAGYGLQIHRNSTAQIGLPVTNNGGTGIRLGSLSFLQNAGLYLVDNAGGDVACDHPTAVSNLCP